MCVMVVDMQQPTPGNERGLSSRERCLVCSGVLFQAGTLESVYPSLAEFVFVIGHFWG
jgi:hypothetical protein